MPVPFTKDPLPAINFGERHVAVAVALDNSGSMVGDPIDELNQGTEEFGRALESDPLALGRADICVVSFNSTVQVEMGFRPAMEYQPPKLEAGGFTCMNGGIDLSLDKLEERKNEYREAGISYYRPWLFLMTDGAPTDTDKANKVRTRLQKAINDKKVMFIPIAIGKNADIETLKSYYPEGTPDEDRIVGRANAENFKEAFRWLSSSISALVNSDTVDVDKILLPPTPSMIAAGI